MQWKKKVLIFKYDFTWNVQIRNVFCEKKIRKIYFKRGKKTIKLINTVHWARTFLKVALKFFSECDFI